MDTANLLTLTLTVSQMPLLHQDNTDNFELC